MFISWMLEEERKSYKKKGKTRILNSELETNLKEFFGIRRSDDWIEEDISPIIKIGEGM